MLFQAVHLPCLYSKVPEPPDSHCARLYYSLVLDRLWDVRSNCVLLADAGDVMWGESVDGTRRWKQNYGHKAHELLKKLRKEHRIVPVRDGEPIDIRCSEGCRRGASIAATQSPDIVVRAAECTECHTILPASKQVCTVDDYALSPVSRERRHLERVELSNRQWTKEQFEEAVWKPVFRHAAHVRIFDRMIGQHAVQRNPLGREQVQIGENFARGLTWIYTQFLAHSAARSDPDDRTFEVTCAIHWREDDATHLREVAEALRRFARDVSADVPVKMSMSIKKEQKTEAGEGAPTGARMRHARFLLTDQVSLLIERGMDLLDEDNMVRDVVVTHFGDRARLVEEVDRLALVP